MQPWKGRRRSLTRRIDAIHDRRHRIDQAIFAAVVERIVSLRLQLHVHRVDGIGGAVAAERGQRRAGGVAAAVQHFVAVVDVVIV